MITQRYFENGPLGILFRIAIDNSAVIDVLTTADALSACRAFLSDSEANSLESVRLGSFGPFEVTMGLSAEDATVTLFIDGPELGSQYRGDQSVGIYIERDEMLRALDENSKFPDPGSSE